jgi:hypothetical protein
MDGPRLALLRRYGRIKNVRELAARVALAYKKNSI